ncbi:MAG: hypothetical protein AB1Z98_39510, partial [Nannocystaceae bacterium]
MLRLALLLTVFASGIACVIEEAPEELELRDLQPCEDGLADCPFPDPLVEQGQNFLDLVSVSSMAPGVTACDDIGPGRFDEDHCYNLQLPPKPSTMRSLVAHHAAWEVPDTDQNVRALGTSPQEPNGGQTFMPGTRST